MRISKSPIIKGGLCGIILSCLINLFIILLFYGIHFEFLIYSIAVISAILGILFLINEKILKLVYSFLSSIILFFITEFVIALTGIVRMLYKHINGASAEAWAGDGFGMIIILLFSFAGYFLGSILAIIFSIVKKRD